MTCEEEGKESSFALNLSSVILNFCFFFQDLKFIFGRYINHNIEEEKDRYCMKLNTMEPALRSLRYFGHPVITGRFVLVRTI